MPSELDDDEDDEGFLRAVELRRTDSVTELALKLKRGRSCGYEIM
jgi:hypothetical protein